MKTLVLLAAFALAGAVSAAEPSRTAEAVLLDAQSRSAQMVIDGRLWRCFGTGCRAQAAAAPVSQPPLRECRRVAAELGALAHYRTGKRAFTPAELAACNTAAKRTPPTAVAGAR